MDDDHDLVRRSQRGDTEAFDGLVVRYRHRIYGLLVQMLRQPDDAWDLTQETFLRAWRGIRTFDGRHVSSWLCRIATHAAIDLCRRKKISPETEWREGTPEPLARPEKPGESMDQKEIGHRIARALDHLSFEQRTVLVLREIEGLSYEEIAEAAGCSMGTVMSRLFHARKNMQTELRDLYESL